MGPQLSAQQYYHNLLLLKLFKECTRSSKEKIALIEWHTVFIKNYIKNLKHSILYIQYKGIWTNLITFRRCIEDFYAKINLKTLQKSKHKQTKMKTIRHLVWLSNPVMKTQQALATKIKARALMRGYQANDIIWIKLDLARISPQVNPMDSQEMCRLLWRSQASIRVYMWSNEQVKCDVNKD